MESRKIRILIAKLGLDGHDRGAKVLSLALRDNGFEVIYTGLHQTPEQIVNSAIQEDVDIIGISILSGAHMVLVPKVIKLAKEREFFDSPNKHILLGGTIVLKKEIEKLKELGVSEVFGPRYPINEIITFVNGLFKEK